MGPRRADELRKAQLCTVAQSQFGVTLNFNHRLDDLTMEVRTLLSSIVQCDCEGCKGGPGNPDLHFFQPAEYQPVTPGQSDDVDNLLQTSQLDVQVTPSGSPTLQVDGASSRLTLAGLALDRLGVSPLDLVNGDSQQQDDRPLPRIPEEGQQGPSHQDLPLAASSAGGQPPPLPTAKSVVKGLSNAVRSLLQQSTPKVVSPHIATPRPGTPRPPLSAPRFPAGPGVHRPAPPLAAPQPFSAPPPPLPRPPGQPRPAPADPASLAATVDRLLDFVQGQAAAATKEREEERVLRNEQLRNQAALSKVLEDLASRPDPASVSSQKGRTRIPHSNPAALALTGCAVAPQYAIQGDLSSTDLKEGKYKIKSGRNVGITQEATINESWPNQYLCPMMMDGLDPKQFDHDRITLIQWAGGFVGKIFAEYNAALNGSKEHNQLFILMKMLRLAEVQPWPEIMKLNQALFSALERGVLTWQSRPELERWWALALESLHNRALRPAATKRPASAPPSAAAGPPAKKVDNKTKKDMFGISGDFLKQKNICIRWNISSCSESAASHPSPDRSATEPVRHVCGGCAFLNKSDSASHPMKVCKFKNSDGIFQ